MAFKIRRPGHIVLRCADVQRSRAFYGDVVGLTEMGNGDRQMYFLTADFDANHHMVLVRPAKLGGPTPDAGRQVGLASVTMEIRSDDDLEALHRRLTVHGAEIERFGEEGGPKRFSVLDPDGNRLEFFCRADAEAHATGGDTQPAAVQ